MAGWGGTSISSATDIRDRPSLARVLPDIGIKGNTHMLMQDDNSLDIADTCWTGSASTWRRCSRSGQALPLKISPQRTATNLR
jgi:hypothetical protein